MKLTGIDLIKALLKKENIEFVADHKFHPHRRWEFDIAIPRRKIAIEYDGGTFNGGRHVRGVGFSGDCQKINKGQIFGWRVLRYTCDMLENDPMQVLRDINDL